MNKIKDRWIHRRLFLSLETMPVVVVTGARQTGKTTLVRDIPPASDRVFHSLDDIETLDQIRRHPQSLLEQMPVTIDEIQRVPEFLLTCKAYVDRNTVPGLFILTGSANLALMASVSESLAGRATYITLPPFCPREWVGLPDGPKPLEALFKKSFSLRDWPREEGDWRSWLLRGGFAPALQCKNAQQRDIWFSGYVNTYLERDLRNLSNVADLGDFQRVMRLAAQRTGRLLNISELARDAAIKQPTCHRYVNLLETGYQLVRLNPYATNESTSIRKSKKIFWTDSGCAAWLAGIHSVRGLDERPDKGFFFEQALFQTLAAWASLDPVKRRIRYWRNRSGDEVDFVLDNEGTLIAIEAKSAEIVRRDDWRGIAAFEHSLGDRKKNLMRKIILHAGSSSRSLGNNCYSLSAGCLFPAEKTV